MPITAETKKCMNDSILTKNQVKVFGPKACPTAGYGRKAMIRATVRYDDQCGNGHNSFSITGDIYIPGKNDVEAGGQLTEEIIKYFPELREVMKWHLCSSDGPMHYIENTIYHTGDRDHNGLRKGEQKQIVGGKTNLPWWKCQLQTKEGVPFVRPKEVSCLKEDLPVLPSVELVWLPDCITGEGKERQLDYARNSAIWPEATDEDLCVEPAVLREKLEARLPALMEDFRKAVESLGFVY